MLEYFDLIKYAIIIALTTAAGNYLTKQGKKPATANAERHIVLRMPMLIRIIGFGSTVIGFFPLTAGLIDFNWETCQTAGFLFLLFTGLGLPLLLMGFVYRLTLTPEGLVQRNMVGQYKSLSWASITTVDYSIWQELKLSDGSTKMKISSQLVGFDMLVTELELRLGKTRSQMGIPVL
ncbi:MAG TPA: hypothetical protein VF629_04710 [Hymenobacter sp.]|jgi:hypothetical protein|uniref:hypothetical protein n=1 Tax=Hymenobacter sp. TaxID=1898978 RepID=UPI002EDBA3C0